MVLKSSQPDTHSPKFDQTSVFFCFFLNPKSVSVEKFFSTPIVFCCLFIHLVRGETLFYLFIYFLFFLIISFYLCCIQISKLTSKILFFCCYIELFWKLKIKHIYVILSLLMDKLWGLFWICFYWYKWICFVGIDKRVQENKNNEVLKTKKKKIIGRKRGKKKERLLFFSECKSFIIIWFSFFFFPKLFYLFSPVEKNKNTFVLNLYK